MKSQRLLELDALRGIAALAVVLYHYFYRYNELYIHESLIISWSYLGRFGVQLFFMISGFVIFWTLNRVDKPADFVVSRISRLYPAYWAAVIITFTVVRFYGLPGQNTSIKDALVNLLMVHEYLRFPHVDGVYWTLSVELMFYFWMFMMYLTSSLGRAHLILSFVIGLSALHSLGFIPLPKQLGTLFILKHLPFFTAGICFYQILNQTAHFKTTIFTLALSLLAIAADYPLKQLPIFAAFYIIFYLALSGHVRFLSLKPFVYLGSISYSLYLIHQNIGYIIINRFYKMHWNPLLGVLTATLASICLATLITRYIEIPSLHWIRNTYKNSKSLREIAEKLTLSGSR